MPLKITKHKAKRQLIGLLLMAGFLLLPSVMSFAAPVKIHSAIENDRLQIVMDWDREVSFKALVDDADSPSGSEGHELLLQFGKAIETSDLEILTKKTSAWLESIRAGYDTLLLQSKDKVAFKVSKKGKKISIKIVRRLPLPPVQSQKSDTNNDLLITFAEKVLADKQTELMRPIFDKHGDGFLVTRPLLAANLMRALKNKSSSLRWMKKAENLPDMTLDQQIEMVALYGKLGQSDKIGKTKHTRKLDDRLARKLNDPKLPRARKEELIYTMLELKAHEMVLPHLKQLAYQQGGDWVYPYEETLVELQRNNELIDFYQVHIKHSGLAVDEKRRIAFRFLELNHKEDALPVFKALAESAAAKSPDVEQLLFLWGPRPAKVDRKWLANRANTSKNEERTQWLRHLTNAGGALEVIQLTGKEPSSRATDSLFSVYLQALEELEDKETFTQALRQWMESETNPDRLWLYGSLAEDQSQLELANEAYEKILVSRSQDEKALTHLGWNSFYLNQWKDTQKYLRPILTKKANDWTTNYYYAEAIYLEGHISESLPFFQKTLALIDKISSPSTEVRMTKAVALERLGRKKEALAIYEHLLKISPTDKKLRVKYISALMEAGDYEQAQNWLTLTAK
jgi:tetratricopeptide (TPR) repeat protein